VKRFDPRAGEVLPHGEYVGNHALQNARVQT
jgi:hypothetical protein